MGGQDMMAAMMGMGVDPNAAQQQQLGYYRPLQMQQPQQGGLNGQQLGGMFQQMMNSRQQQQGANDAAQADQFFANYGY